MNNEIKKEALTEEELKKVNGGTGSYIDPDIPIFCRSVEVKFGENGSELCPYDNSVLDIMDYAPSFSDRLFRCKSCGKWFFDTFHGRWYESDREPD